LIYPTRTAVIATAAGAPFALAFAAIQPGRWFLALAWPLAVVLLTVFDALRSMAPRPPEWISRATPMWVRRGTAR
jgi:hypothetical protein